MSVLSISNGKGGTGKSTAAAEIAACAARSGFRSLLVDLDPQCNLTQNLGVDPGSVGTAGGGTPTPLSGALQGYGSAPVHERVRENLDLLVGDKRLESWPVQANLLQQQPGQDPARALVRILSPLVSAYDLVVIDCPPLIAELNIAALVASDFVLSPVKADRNSIEGLGFTAERFAAARQINPQTQFLGVVLIDIALKATVIQAEVAAEVAKLVGADMMFATRVRSSQRAAWDTRQRGQFYAEYEESAANAPKWYDQIDSDEPAQRFAGPKAAAGVAGDWAELTAEVFRRMSELSSGLEIDLAETASAR